MSEWFLLTVELRQGYVMSPWLFNVYMDSVVQVVNVKVLGKGLELLSANGGRFEINQLLFADDASLVADSEKLCRLVSEFGRVCKIPLKLLHLHLSPFPLYRGTIQAPRQSIGIPPLKT